MKKRSKLGLSFLRFTMVAVILVGITLSGVNVSWQSGHLPVVSFTSHKVYSADYSVNVSVSDNTDDAFEKSSDGTMYLTNASISQVASNVSSARRVAAYKFGWTDKIPLGATITAAYISPYFYYATQDDMDVDIYLEDVVAPMTFSSNSYNITNRVRTTNSVPWVADGIAAGGENIFYNSPSIVTVLQELVNSYSVNMVVAILMPDTVNVKTASTRSYDSSSAVAAKIYIAYTTSEGAPTVITNTPQDIEATTVTFNGTVAAIGSGNVTRGFQWKVHSSGTFTDNWSDVGTWGAANYTYGASGLTPGTSYVVQATANNTDGYGYGANVTFITRPNSITNPISTTNGTLSAAFSWTNGTGTTHTEVRYTASDEGYPSNNVSGKLFYFGTAIENITLTGLSSNLTFYVSIFSHAYDNSLWSTAGTVGEVSALTSTRTYPTYAPYGASPQIVYIGDSIMRGIIGTDDTIEYQLQTFTGYTFLNKAYGGENTDNIVARFPTTVIANNPRIVVADGGTNDLSSNNKTNFLANWTYILDQCQASANISLVLVMELTPKTMYNTALSQQQDDWNISLKALVSGYSKAVWIDTRPYVGTYRSGEDPNMLWDIYPSYTSDDIHFTLEGNNKLAYAVAGGIPLSENVTMPTVTVSAASLITSTTVRLRGNVTDSGGENCTVTIYWGIADGGTDFSAWSDNGTPDLPVQPQSADAFQLDIAGLLPSTLYYMSASGNNTAGVGWATSVNFTTLPSMSISASPATLIDYTTARLNGNLTDDGGESCNVTVHWGLTNGGTNSVAWTNNSTPTAPAQPQTSGVFYLGVTGLPAGTMIFFNVSSNNSLGTVWGSTANFTTLAYTVPVVATLPATLVEETSATLNGEVTDIGGDNVTRGFQYDTDLTAPFTTNWSEGTAYGVGLYSYIPVLTRGDKYAFRAWGANSVGTVYGSILTFMTKPGPAATFTSPSHNNTWVYLTWNNGVGMTHATIRYLPGAVAPTNNVSGTLGFSGFFPTATANITGLTAGTQYTFRIFTNALEDGTWSTADGSITLTVTTSGTAPVSSATDDIGRLLLKNILSVLIAAITLLLVLRKPGDPIAWIVGAIIAAVAITFVQTAL